MKFLRKLSVARAVIALLVFRPSFVGARTDDEPDYSLKVGGLLEADGRFFPHGGGADTFLIRRARVDLRATLAKYFSVRLLPELAGSKLTLLDAFGNVAFIKEIQLQVGKMKSPIGLEFLQPLQNVLCPELGLPSLLVPNRDVGVTLQGELLGGALSYAVGVFNGVADGVNGDEDENDAKDVEGRVFVKPFVTTGIDALTGLGAGIAGSFGDQAGALPSRSTPGRQRFFSYSDTAKADGSRTRFSPQAYYYLGHVGLLGEYVRNTQGVSAVSTTTVVTSVAWQIWGSLVLGGKPDYIGTKVDSPLDPKAGAWGAVELAARYGELRIGGNAFETGLADRTVSAQAAKNIGVAISWWFLAGTRALVGFDQTSFDGGAAGGRRVTERVVVGRLQVGI